MVSQLTTRKRCFYPQALHSESDFVYKNTMTDIRNFGIIAHINAGKTTTTERLLFLSGACRYLGEVDEGTTVTDYLYEERERGITIQSAVAKCNWKGVDFHIIDTPGHVDFMNEVECCLRVLDAAVVVLCGQSGIQAQTENLLRAVSMKNKPLIFYINKLDREAADFERVFYELQEQYPVLALTFPYYEDDKFVGVIDVLTKKLFIQEADKQIVSDIPESAADEFNFYHTLLIDTLSELDDGFLNEALSGVVNEQAIISTLRWLTIRQKITPLYAGSSKRNAGVALLADGIKNYFPSPDDIALSDETPDVFCFKYISHQELGRLRLIKVNKNITLKSGTNLYSAGTGENVAISKIYAPFGSLFEEESEINEGQIAVIEEESDTATSSELYVNYDEAVNAKNCRKINQRPIIFLRIESENPDDREKMLAAGKFLLQEDSTLIFREDSDTGEILLGGMGELHLEIFRERLEHIYKIKTHAGKPAVIPKLMPKRASVQTETSSFIIQGNEIQASLSLEFGFADNDFGKKTYVDNLECVVEGANENLRQAKEILQSQLSGAREHEFINTKVKITSFTTSAELASVGLYCSVFSRLASKIIKDLEVDVLYPQMQLEIFVKPEYTGNINGEISVRHGVVCDISRIEPFDKIVSYAPMEELFGFASRLRSLSSGQGAFSMKLSGYAAKDYS